MPSWRNRRACGMTGAEGMTVPSVSAPLRSRWPRKTEVIQPGREFRV